MIELLDCAGSLLGIDDRAEYREQCTTLAIGDIPAMSTDGLTGTCRRGSNGRVEFFGIDGVSQSVREGVARHPNSLGDTGLAGAQ